MDEFDLCLLAKSSSKNSKTWIVRLKTLKMVSLTVRWRRMMALRRILDAGSETNGKFQSHTGREANFRELDIRL